MVAILLPRQSQEPAPIATAPTSEPGIPLFKPSGSKDSGLAPGTIAVAVLIPVVFLLALSFLIFYLRRRRAALGQNSNGSSNIATPSTTAAAATTTSDSANTPSRRAIRRAERLRRTDSGGTVRTLPKYKELGEDEILLSKSTEALPPGSRHNSRDGRTGRLSGRRQDSDPAGSREGSVSRQSSLSAVLRRLSLRRSEPEPPIEDESNEMEDMLETEPMEEATTEQRMSPVREEQAVPNYDVPEYDQLYPTLPPSNHLYTGTADIRDVESQESTSAPTTSSGRGTRALHKIFRRHAPPASSSADLGLTLTRSNEVSLYRPSTSSSRRSIAFGSSISLLSQNGIESSDTLGRGSLNGLRHTRNISAPISTRRLQFAAPAAGFSDQQMHFLTSVESLDKYGVPMNDETSQDAERQQQRPPPSFEELAREEERELIAKQKYRNQAPLLTTAELQARQELPSNSLRPLPGQQTE